MDVTPAQLVFGGDVMLPISTRANYLSLQMGILSMGLLNTLLTLQVQGFSMCC